MNNDVGRAVPVSKDGKCPIAALRRIASFAETRRAVMPSGPYNVPAQQIVVSHPGHRLEQPPGDDHAAVGVADVLARLEERAALPPSPSR
jgi:hypothetical protein